MKTLKKGYVFVPLAMMCLTTACVSVNTKSPSQSKSALNNVPRLGSQATQNKAVQSSTAQKKKEPIADSSAKRETKPTKLNAVKPVTYPTNEQKNNSSAAKKEQFQTALDSLSTSAIGQNKNQQSSQKKISTLKTNEKINLKKEDRQLNNRQSVGNISCLNGAIKSGQTLDLMEAIERSVCNNPETKSAWIDTKIKAAQVKMTQSQYYPQVTGTVDYNRGKSNTDYKNTDILSYDSKIKRYGVAVQASWLLFDFGSRKQLLKESQNLLAMSFAQDDYVLQAVMLQTIQAYYEVIKLELQQDNLKQLEAFAQKNYDISSARYNAGAGIKSDQLQMHANWVKAKSDLIKLNGDLKVAKGNLSAAMGNMAYQEYNIRTDSIDTVQLMDLKPIQTLLKDAEQYNPQLKQSEYAISAAQHKVKSLERARYPSVSFISNFNRYTQDGEGSYANTSQQLQTGIQLNLPIFDGFNRKYQITEARQTLQQRYAEKEKVEQELTKEVWKNYNLLEASIDNTNALKALSKSAEESYSVAQGRYQSGIGNIVELINAQNLLTEANMKYSTALTEYLVIRFQLLSNVGILNVWEK